MFKKVHTGFTGYSLKVSLLKTLIFLMLFILLYCPITTNAQSLLGDYRDRKVLPTKDTLVLDIKQSDWWFGAASGANFNFYFSDLKFPRDPNRRVDSLNFLVNFPAGFGGGSFIGAMGEWMPNGKKWGAQLRVLLYDFRSSQAETKPFTDSVQTSYETKTDFHYLTISPSARYNLAFLDGLHLLGGLDFEIIMSSTSIHTTKFEHSANIDIDRPLKISAVGFRFAGHLGLAYDFIVTDISNKIRVLFSPYITIHGGTNVISAYGSTRNLLLARAGLAIKFGPNIVNTHTLAFDPNYIEPPQYYATTHDNMGVDFPGFTPEDVLPPVLAYFEKPVITEEIAEASIVEVSEGIATSPERKKFTIKAGQAKTFNYPTPSSTTLSDEVKDYLDAIADFLKKNPSATVRLVGHSDAAGTFTQNQQRSDERARQARLYLASKNIGRDKIFERGAGSREAVGDNRTEEGRAKNRRLEIVVVQ